MAGETAASCCCTSGVYYQADLCPIWFDNPCCDIINCAGGPLKINLCEAYLKAIGVPLPPQLTPPLCVVIVYDCCAYILDPFPITGPCPPPSSPYPTNVGFLAAIYPEPVGGCCQPQGSPAGDQGDFGSIPCPEGGNVLNPPDACIELWGNCYDHCDQFGTVIGKEVEVTCRMSTCYLTYGIPPNTPCDFGPPETIAPIVKTITQKIGSCIPCEEINGTPILSPCTQPIVCEHQKFQQWYEFYDCPDCPPLALFKCCEGVDLCAIDPDACAGYLDPSKTWDANICYQLIPQRGDWIDPNAPTIFQEEPIFTVRIPACIAADQGVNLLDPVAVTAWVTGTFIPTVDLVNWNTCWGPIATQRMIICGLTMLGVSTTAQEFAERLQARLRGIIEVDINTEWGPWFWFGTRQTCVECVWQEDPNGRPPYRAGDELQMNVAGIYYDAGLGQIIVPFIASAAKFVNCISVSMRAGERPCLTDQQGDGKWTTTKSISAEEPYPYTLQGLSIPQYAKGARYTLMRCEEPDATFVEICIGPSETESVQQCIPIQEPTVTPLYPYESVLDPNDDVIIWGYSFICDADFPASSKCRCYPFQYEIIPCDYADNPIICCTFGCFQNFSVYCETFADDIEVRSLCDPN